jgi:hypothetical protein
MLERSYSKSAIPPCVSGHVTFQREHAGPRQSLDEGALKCSAIRKLLEPLPMLDIVLPLPIIHMRTIRTRVDTRTMPLSVLPVSLVCCTVLPGEGSNATVHTICERPFISAIVRPSAQID